MKSDFWLEQIPIWGIFFLTGILILVSIWVGIFLGKRIRHKPDHITETSLGSIILAILGLLAFMLAFTFGLSAERFQARRQLLLDEVVSIGTTYLRAEMLSEPHRSEIRKLLRQYVDGRVNLAKESMQKKMPNLRETVLRSESLQNQIWSHTVAIAADKNNSVINALFINSLNNMIDLQTSRLAVLNYKTAPIIWYVLYFITVISMITVGFQLGLTGKKGLIGGIFLALTFSSVIFLIADIDRATEGYLQVNQRPMFELQKHMQADEANQIEKAAAPAHK